MITFIIKHELVNYIRDGKVRFLIISVTLISVFALIISFYDYQHSYQTYNENVAQARLNWENQTEKNPHDAAHDGTYVIKPIHPLYYLDKGIRPYTGQVIHLGAHQRKLSTINESKDLTGLFRFGELNPSFVLIYMFPLFLIFIGYNTFTKEKESQTIRLLAVQGVTSRQISLGKWAALILLMTFLFSLFFIYALLNYIALEKEITVTLSEWLLIYIIFMLYFSIFVSVSIWVSSKSKSSGISLSVLLSIWIFITLIVPKVSTNLSGELYPFPTLQSFKENIYSDQAEGLNGHNFWNEAAQDFQQKVLDEYGVDSLKDLPVEYSGLLLAEGEKYESEIYTKHFDLLQDQYRKQRWIYRLTSVFSPMISLRFLSMSATRSDYGFLWHFEDEAEKYRVIINTDLNMNIAEKSKGVERYTAGSELWEAIPRFNYKWQTFYEIVDDHLIEFGVLISWAIFCFSMMIFFNRSMKDI